MEKKKQQIWKTWRFDVAKNMPPLNHSIPGEVFDITQSEVVAWLMRQPEIMQLVFNIARSKKYIAYDPETRTWKGVDYAQ